MRRLPQIGDRVRCIDGSTAVVSGLVGDTGPFRNLYVEVCLLGEERETTRDVGLPRLVPLADVELLR